MADKPANSKKAKTSQTTKRIFFKLCMAFHQLKSSSAHRGCEKIDIQAILPIFFASFKTHPPSKTVHLGVEEGGGVPEGLLLSRCSYVEAYPNPTPVTLEITAQAPGLLGRGDGTLLHHPHGDWAIHHARH